MAANETPGLLFYPLTGERWGDLEALFGPRGACGGCWCMWWRLTRSQFAEQKGEGNRQAMHELVLGGRTPGILAYHQNQAVAWCAVAPRAEFPALDRSRILKPVDAQPVWSIVCFFVAKPYRHRGISVSLARAAVAHAAANGARIVEAYPMESRDRRPADASLYTGLASTFRTIGFTEVARRSDTRPIMRYSLPDPTDTRTT